MPEIRPEQKTRSCPVVAISEASSHPSPPLPLLLYLFLQHFNPALETLTNPYRKLNCIVLEWDSSVEEC